MADDFDVEAMLEAPYKKEDEAGRNGESDHHRDRDRERDKDRRKRRSRSRDRDGHKSRKRSRSRDRHGGSKSERKRSRSKDKKDSKSDRHKERDSRHGGSRYRSPDRFRGGDRGRSTHHKKEKSRSKSPLVIRNPQPDLTPEERDARTVFCMQMSARIRPRDIEEFFSSVGKVKDVRIITDNKTRRSKGIAYVEFQDTESVPLALGLTGQRLLGVPIMVQASQAEKNRLANATTNLQKGNSGPMRLYVGSLHFNITEDMLRGIFEPFGKIEHINLVMDNETGRSKGFGFVTIDEIKLIKNHETNRSQGYGFLTFHDSEDAKKALEQLNGFELAGRPMKVGHVTERTAENQGASILDSDEMDRAGIDLGATGRLQLMAKLAEGTGFQIPQVAANALNLNPLSGSGQTSPTHQQPGVPTMPDAPLMAGAQPGLPQAAQQTPPIATQCFMLSNMFDPTTETQMNWDVEIRDDVIEECTKHGGVLHIYVDKASPQGNVYVKCPSISAAVASVQALHGRWFAGKVITAAYVPLINYHALFQDAARATAMLLPSTQGGPGALAAAAAGAVLIPGAPGM